MPSNTKSLGLQQTIIFIINSFEDYFDLSLDKCHHHNFPKPKTDIQIASLAK